MVVDVRNVSIRYRVGDFRNIGLKEFLTQKVTGKYDAKDFWAVDDVSFQLEKGDFLGIIGTNGAGKTTLLKAVTGVMKPAKGTVETHGQISALLALGTGFDDELTVKENIYLRGAFLGYTEKFMNEKYPEIIEFSELQEFENYRLRQLSSGMKSRMAFSIASLINPDILILDEVLAVGDGAFRQKSEAKMMEIIKNGTTTLFVSHSIAQVRKLCNKVLWLDHGKQMAFGDTKTVCNAYDKFLNYKKKGVKPPMYDYLIVGAGLYGAVFARQMTDKGKKVLVIDKRPNIAGNVYTEDVEGIHVHKYGAHIFHTNHQKIWEYVNRFAQFNHFVNSPIAKYKGEVYSLPFNMYTFNKMWGVASPEEAQAKINAQRLEAGIKEPKNLEEQAISLVGTDIYHKLIKGYTEKQWGRDCKELPAFIIKRLPVRLTYDNNYFNALYQGIPMGGYTKMVAKMLEGIEVKLNEDYLADKAKWDQLAEKIVYTGAIDAYFSYSLGALEYRSVRFETEVLDIPNFQGNAAVNYTDRDMPWTRIIEHKWFEFGKDDTGNDIPRTVISREYSSEWKQGDEPYYPINDEKNSKLYAEYKKLAEKETKVIFGGRLGEYKYYDMDAVIDAALTMADAQND